MSENRKVGFVVAAENETKQTFDEIKRDAGSMAQSVEQSGKRAAKGMQDVGGSFKKTGDGADDASKKVDASTRSLISSIQRATAAAEAGEKGSSKYFETLAKQRGIGGDVLEPYLAQMRKAEAAQAASVKTLGSMEMSAKQTTAALRGVPAQFTDIFVSLQGGQAPLTVLLQQGGQLKDMFGGTGAAAKALGGYVLSLISPTTLLAAGVAAVGVAYYQGSKEQDAWVKGIVTTGNASGVTVSQLRDYARQIDAVVGTQAKAAEGLAAFAAAGIRGGEELKRYTQTAIEWEQATGQAVEKTAEQFSSLQKDPLSAVLKLNEGTNFLTASVYEQIASLEKQGDKAGAAELAMNALDAAMRERSKAIQDSLGYIERGWIAAKNAAKEAWDAMLGVGRSATLGDEIARVQAQIDQQMAQPLAVDTPEMRASREKGIANKQRELTLLRDKLALEELNAAASAESARITQSRIEFDKKYAQALQSQLSLQDKLALARKEATDAGKSEAEITQVLAYITEQHNKSIAKGGDGRKAAQSSYQSLMVAINQSVAASENELKVGEKLTESQKLRLRYEQELATKKRGFTQQEKANIEMGLLAAEAAERNADAAKKRAKALEEEAKAYDKQVKKQEAFIASIRSSVDKLRLEEEGHMLAAAANISHAEAVERITLARLEESYAQMLQGAGSLEEIERIRAEIAARKELLGVLGQKAAREANAKAAEEAAKDWERTSKTIGDTLADYIMSGGKDAATYLKRLFSNLVLQPVVQTVVGDILGFGGGSAGGAGAAGGGGVSGVLNGASNLRTLYSGLTGGFATSLGTGIASLGSTFGSAAITAFGNGMAMTATQAAAAAQAYAAAGYQSVASGIAGGAKLGATITKAVPWVAGAVALAAAFGAFRKTKVVDTGIMGTLGVEGGIHDFTQKRKSGSLFSGPKYTLVDEGVSSFDKPMQDAFKAMRNAAIDMGEIIGLATGHLKDFTSAITLDSADSKSGTRGLNLMGLSEAEVQAKVQQALELANNEMAQQLIGSWEEVTVTVEKKFASFLGNASKAVGEDFRGTALKTTSEQVTRSVYTPSEYALEGEKAIETLTRLASSLGTVNPALKDLNLALYEGSLAGADMAYKLSTLFGGLEGFAAATSSFYQNFYTEEEKRSKLQEKLAEAFSAINLTLPDIDSSAAREQYRALAEAQDLTTESGRAAWSVIMQLGDAFASITPTMGEAAQAAQAAQQAAAQAAQAAQQAAAQAVVDAVGSAWSNLGSMANLAAQYTGNAAGLNAQLAVTQGSYATADNTADRLAALQEVIALEQSIWGLQQKQRQSEAQAIQEGIKAAQEQLTAQQDLLRAAQSLGEFASDLFSSEQSGLSTAERQAVLQSDYQMLLARAQGGDADAMGQLHGVSRDYLQLAQKTAVSEADYSVLSGMVAAQLASVSAISQASATSQTQRLEDQIKRSQQQADALSAAQFAVSDQTRVAIESLLTESISGFDDQLRSMRGLSDLTEQQLTAIKQWPAALNGIMSATLVPSIQGIAQSASSSAVSAYVAANAAAEEQRMRRAAELVADQLRQKLAAAQAAAEAAAKAAIASASAAGVTVPAFAAGGLHSGGVRLVGEYGPELEVTGPARYFNAQQTQQMLSGGGNAELVAENRRLQQRVAYLQAHMERVANATERLADMFENASAGGNAMAVEVMRMPASLVEAV